MYNGLMGKDKWAEVIEYLRSSKRDPKKTLKLLQAGEKGHQSNYNISRSSYTLNIIATLTQKISDPKNKNKNITSIIRTWVKSKDFEMFYNLMRHEEGLKYIRADEKAHRQYTKQIKDLWYSKTKEAVYWKKYFKETNGILYVNDIPKNKNIHSNTSEELARLKKKRS
jgi:hypothetical protein